MFNQAWVIFPSQAQLTWKLKVRFVSSHAFCMSVYWHQIIRYNCLRIHLEGEDQENKHSMSANVCKASLLYRTDTGTWKITTGVQVVTVLLVVCMLKARSSTWSPPGTEAVPPREGERIILPSEDFKPHRSQCFASVSILNRCRLTWKNKSSALSLMSESPLWDSHLQLSISCHEMEKGAKSSQKRKK